MKVVIDPKRWKGIIKGDVVDILNNLLPRDVKTFMALTFMADTEGKVVESLDAISEQSGLCKITLRRAFKALHRLGIIWVEDQGRGPGASITIHITKRYARITE